MPGLGSPGRSGGVRGVGRLLLYRLGWGLVRPFFVSLAWVGLEVAGLGGVTDASNVGGGPVHLYGVVTRELIHGHGAAHCCRMAGRRQSP